jgi:LysM repeat protein
LPTLPFYYVVKAGETLTILSERFGVSVDAIAAANGIVDKDLIITGHTLLIPAP